MYREKETRPNIVLINVDQMRGDCLSAAGHPVVETPYLDSLNQNGVQFTKCYSACPSCIPARAALLTGMSQKNHKRVGYKDGVPWNFEHTLPGELSKSGYQAQGIGKMHFYPARSLNGFNDLILHDGYLHFERNRKNDILKIDDYLVWLKDKLGMDADHTASGMDCNSWTVNPWPYEEQYHPTNWVVTESIDFLRRRDERMPFFLWMSFVRPHPPFDPPKNYLDMYLAKDIPGPFVGDWARDLKMTKYLEHNAFFGNLDKEMLRRTRAAYYALITHIDCQIGRFLIALSDNSLLDNTAIIFTSDHGELLGDHHLFRKGLPYNGSARVPLFVKLPESWKGKKNEKLSALCELRDIMPTVLDIAGVKNPDSVDGKSLLPLITGKEKGGVREYLHGEHALGEFSNHYIATEKNEKYIWYSQTGRELFFDLNKDPNELQDLSGTPGYQKRIKYCRDLLIKELKGREEGYSNGKKLFTGRKFVNVLVKS